MSHSRSAASSRTRERRCSGGSGLQDRGDRGRSDGSVVRGTSADVAELITWHVVDEVNGHPSVCLNTWVERSR
jgi:hypothetical protein